jgi:hypothetical protein
MSVLEDVSETIIERPLLWLVIGVAALSSPKIIGAIRPLLKGAIKGGMALSEKTKEVFAESKERMQDVYEEARYEYKHEGLAEKEEEPVKETPKPAYVRRAQAAEKES